MPYRHAWLYVLALLALTFVAFWPSYLSVLPKAHLAHHYHAGSSVLWTLLAAFQSWTVHHGRLPMHRIAGWLIFLLFPFFLVAGLWVIHVETTTLAAGLTDPDNLTLSQFGFFDPLANIGFGILFWGGLRYRHKVQLHARYMLGTVMFVVAPVIWRLLREFVPFLAEGKVPFDVPFALGNAGALAIALILYRQAPNHGRPWLLVSAIIATQTILFLTVGKMPGWAPIFASIASLNLPALLVATAIVSLGIACHGWVAGARPVRPEVPATA